MTAPAKVEQRHRDEARAFVDHAGLKQMALAQALANAEQRGREDEREECAKVCDEMLPPNEYAHDPMREGAHEVGCDDCAAAIRARGQRKDASLSSPDGLSEWE